ncbi:hypothetical protein B0H16DRAFT_1885409 [Mycena metata]|uniref:Uncharacterized protein n=1 Tax=Mycena metata TaxID=1033252 RepID=A0AAD7J9H8_9AGAR|nr:hypothetical protein B0H16DRAFT_1885409 [Mycena metata]
MPNTLHLRRPHKVLYGRKNPTESLHLGHRLRAPTHPSPERTPPEVIGPRAPRRTHHGVWRVVIDWLKHRGDEPHQLAPKSFFQLHLELVVPVVGANEGVPVKGPRFEERGVGGFRGFSSLPVRQPRRFWDFHVPQGAWDYHPREKTVWPEHDNFRERARNWVSVPDTNLPAPWSCDWSHWPYAAAMLEGPPVETSVAASYALSDAPLTPVMFDFGDTVFACARTEASSIAPALPLGSGRGFRVVAQEPYQQRTLWDMCPPPETFGHIPRSPSHSSLRFPLALFPRMSEWPQIPDSALPEPWSADWPAFIVCHRWYAEYQVELEERFGRALTGFIPALFQPEDCRGDTVLCPPGGAGTYYLWGSELRYDMLDPGPMPEMQRFRGVFASVEHLVRAADWNSLEEVAECPNTYSS